MKPRPDYGLDSYKGSGKLKNKVRNYMERASFSAPPAMLKLCSATHTCLADSFGHWGRFRNWPCHCSSLCTGGRQRCHILLERGQGWGRNKEGSGRRWSGSHLTSWRPHKRGPVQVRNMRMLNVTLLLRIVEARNSCCTLDGKAILLIELLTTRMCSHPVCYMWSVWHAQETLLLGDRLYSCTRLAAQCNNYLVQEGNSWTPVGKPVSASPEQYHACWQAHCRRDCQEVGSH